MSATSALLSGLYRPLKTILQALWLLTSPAHQSSICTEAVPCQQGRGQMYNRDFADRGRDPGWQTSHLFCQSIRGEVEIVLPAIIVCCDADACCLGHVAWHGGRDQIVPRCQRPSSGSPFSLLVSQNTDLFFKLMTAGLEKGKKRARTHHGLCGGIVCRAKLDAGSNVKGAVCQKLCSGVVPHR